MRRISAWNRLLQACDNLSLLTCVAFDRPATLLHPLPLKDGGASEVRVRPMGPRHFELSPWPFASPELTFTFPALPVARKVFNSSTELEEAFRREEQEMLSVSLCSNELVLSS